MKQQPYSGIKAAMVMAGERMCEVDYLSFVGPVTLAVVVRRGYGATLVQVLTDRAVHSPDCR
jgi:hypothetical protein